MSSSSSTSSSPGKGSNMEDYEQTQTKTTTTTTTTGRRRSITKNATKQSRRGFLETSTQQAAKVVVAATSVAAGATSTTVPLWLTPEAAVAATNNKKKQRDKVYTIEPDSLRGKTIVITGGSSGLGLESAKRLAIGGATIIVTARTEEKGQRAIQEIQQYLQAASISNPNVYTIPLDLDDLEHSVKTFPQRYETLMKSQTTTKSESSESELLSIDVLMNNAGVMAIPNKQLTKDGYERTFQSNHLGHFVLTALLWKYLSPSNTSNDKEKDVRIINVSSQAYNLATKANSNQQGLDLSNLNGELSYEGWNAYGLSKLENIYFTQELQRRINQKQQLLLQQQQGEDNTIQSNDSTTNQFNNNNNILVFSLHPGAVNTDLARNFVGEEKWNEYKQRGPQGIVEQLYNRAISSILLSVEEGASTQVFLAGAPKQDLFDSSSGTDNNLSPGGLFYDRYKPQSLPKWTNDETISKQLWSISEQLSGVSFTI